MSSCGLEKHYHSCIKECTNKILCHKPLKTSASTLEADQKCGCCFLLQISETVGWCLSMKDQRGNNLVQWYTDDALICQLRVFVSENAVVTI